jgi:hypothetical protein
MRVSSPSVVQLRDDGTTPAAAGIIPHRRRVTLTRIICGVLEPNWVHKQPYLIHYKGFESNFTDI